MNAIPTRPSVTSRSFETAVQLTVEHANATGVETLLVFDHVYVEVLPGETPAMVAGNFLAAEKLVVARLATGPCCPNRGGR